MLKNLMQGRSLSIAEKTNYLLFMINAFQSLEDDIVSKKVMSLASLRCWHSLSFSRFQMELCLNPDLIRSRVNMLTLKLDCHVHIGDLKKFSVKGVYTMILNSDMPREDVPLPLSFQQGDNVDYADVSPDVTNDTQKSWVDVGEYEPQVNQYDGSKSFDLPVQTGLETKCVNDGYTGEPSNYLDFDPDYLLDEPYYDATNGDFPLDESSFFQADDLKSDVEIDYGLDILNEYTSIKSRY